MIQSDIHQGGYKGLSSQRLGFSLAGMVTGVLLAFVFSLFYGGWAFAKESVADDVNSAGLDEGVKARLQENYGKLPLYFIRNDGQVDSKVKFYEKGSGHTTYFTKEGVYLLLGSSKQVAGSSEKVTEVVKLSFLDANKDIEIVAADPQEGKVNYFTGSDPKKWRTNIPTYKAVLYKEVYPGIDIKFYGNNQQMEYDIMVKPGADPSMVAFGYEGVEGLHVTEAGDMEVVLSNGRMVQRQPVVYQEIEGSRLAVIGTFRLLGAMEQGMAKSVDQKDTEARSKTWAYGIDVAQYQKEYPLIIDPVLLYSTYLGGNNVDTSSGIGLDSSGNAYVIGSTSSSNFPTVSPLQGSNAGGTDVFVAKINPSGSALLYSTYLGGSGTDVGYGIEAMPNGQIFVTGETYSSNFPTVRAVQGSYGGGGDAFMARIDPSGSALFYSTYLGGSGLDYGNKIAWALGNSAFVTGYTSSSNFPTVEAVQGSYGGGGDAFVAYFYDDDIDPPNPNGNVRLSFSTYLGGIGMDMGNGIALLIPAFDLYITGTTNSPNFPMVNPLQNYGGGYTDAFVTRLAFGIYPYKITFSSYLGGSGSEEGFDIAADVDLLRLNAYVTGLTDSPNFPTVNPLQGSYGGGGDAFVAKINSTSLELLYSTYLGGSGFDQGNNIQVDGSKNAYLTGYTSSSNFPTANPLQGSNGGNVDAFMTRINPSGSILLTSTFLGGNSDDVGKGIAVDRVGNAYVTGWTTSSNFPTANYLQGSNGGGYDAFVAKMSSWPVAFRADQAASGDQQYPWAAYNATTGEYLVLWQDKRNGLYFDIYGVRLDRDGNRIGSDFAVSTASGHQQRAQVKAGGGGYLAVWHDLRRQSTQGADIYGAWIDGAGNVGAEIPICTCPRDQWNPKIGYDPVSNTFLVAFIYWNGTDFDVWGAVVPAGGGGSVAPFPMLTVAGGGNNDQRAAWLGYDYGNNRYYMAWNDRRNGTTYDIYGSRVSTSGALLDGSGILLGGATGNQFRPTVTDRRPAAGINNHVIAWADYRNVSQGDVYGIRVDGTGVIGGAEFAISTFAMDKANVTADVDWIRTRKSLVGWIMQRGSTYDIFSTTIDQVGTVDGDTNIAGGFSGAPDEQRAQVVTYATDGVTDYGFLAVWMDRRNGTDYDIYGIKVWP